MIQIFSLSLSLSLSLSKAWISRCIVLSYIQYVHLDIHAPKQMFDILASYHKFESRDIASYSSVRQIHVKAYVYCLVAMEPGRFLRVKVIDAYSLRVLLLEA